jgi:hypothetical protein
VWMPGSRQVERVKRLTEAVRSMKMSLSKFTELIKRGYATWATRRPDVDALI